MAWYLYLLPLIPLATRVSLILVCRPNMLTELTDLDRAPSEYRALSVALCALSYTGLVALAILEGQKQAPYQPALYYLLISFLGFLVTTNLQGYKVLAWHGEIGDALFEIGTLGLLLSVAAILVVSTFPPHFVFILLGVMGLVWLADHLVRLRLDFTYFHLTEVAHEDVPGQVFQEGGGQAQSRQESGTRQEAWREAEQLRRDIGGSKWVRTGL